MAPSRLHSCPMHAEPAWPSGQWPRRRRYVTALGAPSGSCGLAATILGVPLGHCSTWHTWVTDLRWYERVRGRRTTISYSTRPTTAVGPWRTAGACGHGFFFGCLCLHGVSDGMDSAVRAHFEAPVPSYWLKSCSCSMSHVPHADPERISRMGNKSRVQT